MTGTQLREISLYLERRLNNLIVCNLGLLNAPKYNKQFNVSDFQEFVQPCPFTVKIKDFDDVQKDHIASQLQEDRINWLLCMLRYENWVGTLNDCKAIVKVNGDNLEFQWKSRERFEAR